MVCHYFYFLINTQNKHGWLSIYSEILISIYTLKNARKLVAVLCALRMNSPEDKYSDSEFSDSASSVDSLWQPNRLCQDINTMSGTENDARRLARRKLFIACAVSLVFMTGEVIGEMIVKITTPARDV